MFTKSLYTVHKVHIVRKCLLTHELQITCHYGQQRRLIINFHCTTNKLQGNSQQMSKITHSVGLCVHIARRLAIGQDSDDHLLLE